MAEVGITEFEQIDTDSVHGVKDAANGTPFLMLKQMAGTGDDNDDDKPEEDEEPDENGKATKELFYCGDEACAICVRRAAKAKLKAHEREALSDSEFALPGRRYPIHDKAHARNALSRVSQYGTGEERGKVRNAVARRFPQIGGKKKGKKKAAKELANRSELMRQTESLDRGAARNTDVLRPQGKPNIPDLGFPTTMPQKSVSSPAPSKDVPKDEALAQTRERTAAQSARKASDGMEVDMKGDHISDGTDVVSQAEDPTQMQTKDMHPFKPEVITEQMDRQSRQAQKESAITVLRNAMRVAGILPENEAAAKTVALPQITEKKALKHANRLLRTLQGVASWSINATKELEDMNAAELSAYLDDRDARKAAEKKGKKEKAEKKRMKAEKKAKKSAEATKSPVIEEAADDAAKSITPEFLVEGVAKRVSEAMEEAVKSALQPMADKIRNLENQPARPRPALSNLAGKEPVMRDQNQPQVGAGMFAALKPLEDAFKSEMDPQKKEKLGGELTLAKLTVRERLAQGRPASAQ